MRSARSRAPDSALRSRVMARLAAALTPPVDYANAPEIMTLMRESMHMARRIDDRHALLYSMQFAGTMGLLVPEHERLGYLEETLALARMLDQPLVILNTLPAYITALLAIGARAQAETLLPEYAELLQISRQPIHQVRHLLVHALLLALRGDFPGADRLGDEAGVIARQRLDNALPWFVHRLSLAQLRARPELLVAEGPVLLGYLSLSPAAIPHAAWLLTGLGRTAEARALLARTAPKPEDIPSANLWDLLGTAEACVLLDEADLGQQVYPLLERATDRMLWNVAPGAIVGPTSRALGDLACLIGRFDEAVRHYDDAIAFCEKLQAPALVELCQERRQLALAKAALHTARGASAGPEPPAPHTRLRRATGSLQLRREGDVWAVTGKDGNTVRIKHVKGLQYLEYLLAQPGREVHVIELAGIDHRTGDAGPVLDAQAKASYRTRLDELGEELREAERFGDRTRASRAEQEIDAIAEQLASAVGLGGRDRRAASDVERTRINVQRRLKDAIERIAAADPALGRYLAAAVKTGTTCVFQPV